uniref:Hematopoietic cell-specific Lyn substrate 1 n=1 Tax=Neogobius melanostomus TaxID=47308 RepID=A0A8C6WLJ5_9GOBI
MWKSVVGHNVNAQVTTEDGDDWETDPNFENDITEQEQRWGAKTIEGSGRKEHISVADLRQKVVVEHEQVTKKAHIPKASYGYGGKFGVEKDRMDKVALGNDYVAQVEQHSSQRDASQGFGGKFGVQRDRNEKVDKVALGYDYKGETEKHQSQKAKAIYDYQGEADDEISFNPEDIITNVEMIDEGWWKGQCHGRIGLFPAAYVELLQ